MKLVLLNCFIIICQIFSLASFYPNNVAIENKNISKLQDYVKINANYPEITGMTDSKFQENLNKEIENKVTDFVKNVEKAAKDSYDSLEKMVNYYECMVSYKYNINGSILSIIMEYYSYLGGAHGITLRESMNIDTEKGVKLQLKDLFKDKENYKQYILKNINSEISKNPENYFSPKLDTFKENNFYLDEDGNLVIYFNQYEVAPYVAGIVEFKMPLN